MWWCVGLVSIVDRFSRDSASTYLDDSGMKHSREKLHVGAAWWRTAARFSGKKVVRCAGCVYASWCCHLITHQVQGSSSAFTWRLRPMLSTFHCACEVQWTPAVSGDQRLQRDIWKTNFRTIWRRLYTAVMAFACTHHYHATKWQHADLKVYTARL